MSSITPTTAPMPTGTPAPAPTPQPTAPVVPATLPNFASMSPAELKTGAVKFVQMQQQGGKNMKEIVSTLSSWGITLNADGTASYQDPSQAKSGIFPGLRNSITSIPKDIAGDWEDLVQARQQSQGSYEVPKQFGPGTGSDSANSTPEQIKSDEAAVKNIKGIQQRESAVGDLRAVKDITGMEAAIPGHVIGGVLGLLPWVDPGTGKLTTLNKLYQSPEMASKLQDLESAWSQLIKNHPVAGSAIENIAGIGNNLLMMYAGNEGVSNVSNFSKGVLDSFKSTSPEVTPPEPPSGTPPSPKSKLNVSLDKDIVFHTTKDGVEFSERGIVQNGIRIGKINLEKNPEGYKVISINIEPKFQSQGFGSNVYDLLNSESIDKTGNPLSSSNTLTDEGKQLWNSLVKSGKAIKKGDSYEMLPIENNSKTIFNNSSYSKGKSFGDFIKNGKFGDIVRKLKEPLNMNSSLGVNVNPLESVKKFGRSFAKTPPEVQGAITSIVKTPEDAQQLSTLVKDSQTEAKTLKSSPRATGPKQSLGDLYFGKGKTSIQEQLSQALKDSGTIKSDIVNANADVPVKVIPKMAVDESGNPILNKQGKPMTSFDQYIEGQGIEQDLKEPDQVRLYDFRNDLASLSKNPTLKWVDSMIDKWQESVYDKKSPNYIRDENLRNTIKNEVGSLNSQLKTSVEESIPNGADYRDANTKYSQVIQTKGELMDKLGELNTTTGRYSGADALLSHINDTEGSFKNLWDAIETHTPKIGNLTLTEQGVIKNFIHDIYTGSSVKSALQNVPRFGLSAKSIAFRTAMNFVMSGITNPDTIIGKLLDLIDQAGKLPQSGE